MDTVTLALGAGEVLLDRLLEEGIAVTHECGGKLACSTCQVVVREGMGHLSAISEDELDMLERASAGAPGTRLACQAVSAGGEVVISLPESALPARATGSSPIQLSDAAAAYLLAQIGRPPGAVAVRLGVERAGCSGFRYRVHRTDEIREADTVFESAGVRIAVDAASLPYVQGTRVDLVREGLAQRLRYENPNVRQSCGCGESFGVSRA
ncbi:MAG TPA: iron-sulfur cluster assembly accessory protein [Burkholderiales bacterium]|nr:iron-sulfur cluster assembly accessory protein [Burkholderiales bacterium]